ncbi:MAG: hypothetical protein MUC83_06110 [Pirellula sp.]|jgi:ABC-type transporter Mla subunit MlaD|nr:hypothetical protein [Pirellula sp.]
MNNEPFRLRYANRIVGVFLLILLVSITSIAVMLANLSGVMTKRADYFCDLPESVAIDLVKGTEVLQLGEQIGRVVSLEYVEDSTQVRLKLSINPPYEQTLTTLSYLSLERKFGVGATYLKIRRLKNVGESSPTALVPGDSIPFITQDDPLNSVAGNVENASSSIRTIQTEMTPTLSSVKSASDSINLSVSEQINPAMKQSKAAFESMEATSNLLQEQSRILSAEIQSLTDRTRDLIDKDVSQTLTSIVKASDAAKKASDTVAETSQRIDNKTDVTNDEILKTLEIMNKTLLLVQKLTTESRQVVQIIRGEADDLPGTTAQIKATADDSQELVNEIRSHWLLRNSRSPSSENKQISPSSFRAGGPR